jgi:hypothetical protein
MLALSDRLMEQVAQLQELGHLPGDDLVARLRQMTSTVRPMRPGAPVITATRSPR